LLSRAKAEEEYAKSIERLNKNVEFPAELGLVIHNCAIKLGDIILQMRPVVCGPIFKTF